MDGQLSGKFQKKVLNRFREKCVTNGRTDRTEFIGPISIILYILLSRWEAYWREGLIRRFTVAYFANY